MDVAIRYVDYADRWRSIKSSFTHELTTSGVGLSRNAIREYNLWQRRYWEHTIRDEVDLVRYVDFIHFNPVKHGLVERVVDCMPFRFFTNHATAGFADARADKLGAPCDLPRAGCAELIRLTGVSGVIGGHRAGLRFVPGMGATRFKLARAASAPESMIGNKPYRQGRLAVLATVSVCTAVFCSPDWDGVDLKSNDECYGE